MFVFLKISKLEMSETTIIFRIYNDNLKVLMVCEINSWKEFAYYAYVRKVGWIVSLRVSHKVNTMRSVVFVGVTTLSFSFRVTRKVSAFCSQNVRTYMRVAKSWRVNTWNSHLVKFCNSAIVDKRTVLEVIVLCFII